jgi:Na+/melibiose symporter-like transporter
MSTVVKPRLGLGTRLIYGFGSVAYGVKDQGLSSLLLLFYNQVVGLPAGWVGTALGFALVLDAFADPVIGQVSDHTRSRLGRRHPYLYGSAIPVALAYLLLWNAPQGWPQWALCAWLVACVLTARTFITLYEIPSAALVSEFTEDYDKRTSLLSFRYFFGWLGGIGMTMLAFQVFLAPTKAHPSGLLDRAGYSTYAIVASLVMVTAILVSAAGTHRWIPFLPKPPPRDSSRGAGAVLKEMASTLSHRGFLTLVLSGLFSSMGFGLTSALGVYFGAYYWQFSSTQLTGLVSASALATLLALGIAPALSRLLGKKRGAMLMSVIAFVIGSAPMTLRLLGSFPPNGDPRLLGILFCTTLVATCAFIVGSILVSSMIADVVEDSEVRTGRRSEGLFFSAASLIQKAVSGLGIMLSTLILGLAQFPAHAIPGAVAPEVLRHLAMIYVPALGGLNLIALAILGFYRIDREAHEANLRQLAEVQAAASEGAPDPIHLGG